MEICGFEFRFVCWLAPEREANGEVRKIMPQARYKNPGNLPLNAYGGGPFCRFRLPAGLRPSGVYVLVVGDKVHYVGECAALSKRFNAGYGNISPKNCFKGGQETNCRVNNLVYLEAGAGRRVALWFRETADRKSVEAELCAALAPPWNRSRALGRRVSRQVAAN